MKELAIRKRRKSRRPTHRDKVGGWEELCSEKFYGEKGAKFSISDAMLRREYNRACDGNLKAIRKMLRILDANLKEREKRPGGFSELIVYDRQSHRDDPRNADLAILLLGIGAVSNAALAALGQPDDAGYEARLKALRPNRIEPWVLDEAKNQPDQPPLSGDQSVAIAQKTATSERADVTAWYANRSALLADLMRLRGPGATRFKPGKSGNPSGRPRRTTEKYPYDGFFMEPITMSIGGKKRTMTRLDALMVQLAMKAAKGDEKISDLIFPALMRLRALRWQYPPKIIEVIRR